MEPHEELTNRRAALAHAVALGEMRGGWKTDEIIQEAQEFLAFLNGEEASK